MWARAIFWGVVIGILGGTLVSAESKNYYVRENPNGKTLELMTPDGSRLLLGDFAPDGNYNFRVDIPRELIEPPKAERDPASIDPESGQKTTEKTIIKETLIKERESEKATEREKEKNSDRAHGLNADGNAVVEVDDSDRYVVEANRLFNKGKFTEAHQIVDELIRKKPEYVRAWVMKGSVLYLMKQKDLAHKAWKQASVLEPKNKEIQGLLKRYP